MTTNRKITYTATYTPESGEPITQLRTSARPYTHAAVVQAGDRVGIWSFHGSEAAAWRGTLTGQQRESGIRVIAVVPVTEGKPSKPRKPSPAVEPESQNRSETEAEEPRQTAFTHVVSVDGVERVKATRGKSEANQLFDILVRENPASVVIMTTAKGREVRRHDGPLGEQQPADTTPSATEVEAATSAVISALSKSAGKDAVTQVWESILHGSAEEFREHASRVLSDREVNGRTLAIADWQEAYEHFHPGVVEESHNGSETVEETDSGIMTFASAAELGDTMPQVVLALAALAEQGHAVCIESGLLAGHEETLLAAAPVLAALHRSLVGERVSAGLSTASAAGRKPGRRKVIDDNATRAALAARVESGETLTEAARAVGVSRATAYRLLPKAK